MKKSINDRCPLQNECERKKCDFIRKELECPYYSANAREGYYIEDQEEIRNRQFREHWEHDTVAFLESLKNNGDGKKSCLCQSCKQPDCICAGMQDAEGRADCDGDKNCGQSGCTYAVKHRAAPAVVNSSPESEQVYLTFGRELGLGVNVLTVALWQFLIPLGVMGAWTLMASIRIYIVAAAVIAAFCWHFTDKKREVQA